MLPWDESRPDFRHDGRDYSFPIGIVDFNETLDRREPGFIPTGKQGHKIRPHKITSKELLYSTNQKRQAKDSNDDSAKGNSPGKREIEKRGQQMRRKPGKNFTHTITRRTQRFF